MRANVMFLTAVVVCGLLSLATAEAADRKPNIILIVGDDMGYADVGFHGCKDIPTPHLDALAESGARFTNGYVSGPYCSPTRAGLMTGRYQQRFGHEFNPGGGGEQGLPLSQTTLPDRLKSAGYKTGMVGKWHLGSSEKQAPPARGFQEFFGFLGGAHDYFAPNGILRGSTPAGDKSYLTDAFGREAVAFIERHRAEPFFLYLAFNAVHTPMQADDARLKRFAGIADPTRRTYAAMMVAMDEAIGKVRAKLKEAKLDQDTMVVFISDNGGPTMKGVTINGSVNTPLRGSKRTTLEGGIRVPFLISYPGKVAEKSVHHDPVIQLDLTATILSVAGLKILPEWKIDGVNLLPHLTEKEMEKVPPHTALYWRFGQQMAIRKGDWKLVRYDQAADGKAGVSEPHLFNLREDISESKNRFATDADKAKELQADWDRWNKDNVAPLWGGKMKN